MSPSRFVLLLLALSGGAAFAGDPHAAGPSGDPAAGRAVFETYCQICHGADGKGDGPGAVALNPRPANFSDPKVSAIPDAIRMRAVNEGGAAVGVSPQMPAFKDVLTPQQVLDVVAFLRKFFHS